MPAHTCTFTGTAAEVHLRGAGAAVLTRREAFSEGQALRVALAGAYVGHTRPGSLERPAHLEPVNMNPDGAPYDVTYRAGPPIVVHIDEGGAAGHYQGALPGTRCADPIGCAIEWPAGPRIITLDRAVSEPIALTEELPYGEPSEGAPPPRISEVTLRRAEGTLTCDGIARPLAADALVWTKEVQHIGPVMLQGHTLGIEVRSAVEPQGMGLSLATRVGLGAFGAAVLVAIAVLRRRWLLRVPAAPPPVVETAATRASSGRVDVFFCHAPEDEGLLRALEDHLHPLVQRGELRAWSARQIGPGQDPRKELEAQLGEAKVIVLLVSPALLGSDVLQDVQVKRAMERRAAGTAQVIPVLLRSSTIPAGGADRLTLGAPRPPWTPRLAAATSATPDALPLRRERERTR